MDAVSTTKQDCQEQMAKLNNDLIEANERQAAINEDQAKLNKRVDARISKLSKDIYIYLTNFPFMRVLTVL